MTKDKQWKQVEVGDKGLFVPFQWVDKTPGGSNLGVAGFVICLRWKHGQIKEMWVHPKQQRLNNYWHIKCDTGNNDIHIGSYEGLPNPNAWLIYWCAKHKAVAINVTAPAGAKFIRIWRWGIDFTMTDWSESER
jgi:hypothetical protein